MSMNKASTAVMALRQLLAVQSGAPVPLTSLKALTGLSLSNLEPLFARLRRAGVVVSVRGSRGGYIVHEDITVADVVCVFVTEGFLLTAPVLTALDSVRVADVPVMPGESETSNP